MADQAKNIFGKRPPEGRDDPAFKRQMCQACMMLLDPYVQVGCNRCNGSFCSRPACYAAHLLGNDAAGHACCTRNSAQCNACGATYCTANCANQHILLGADAAGHACCPTNSAQCNACGARYCTANCANQHSALGADAAGHACCPTNSAQCNACGARHCTANCSNQHTALGSDAAGHACCPTNSAQCNACGARHCTANCSNQHTALGSDAAGHACCPTNSTQCNACGARHCTANCSNQHTALGSDAAGHACCPTNSAQCNACGARHCTANCSNQHTALGSDAAGHACCPTNSAECNVCKKRVCNACQSTHGQLDDAKGHRCCPGNASQCPSCNSVYCNAECKDLHLDLGKDLNDHPCCPSNSAECPVCKKRVCASCQPSHLKPKDKLGHDCCAGNSGICTYCAVTLCKACQSGHQVTLGPHCGHTTCVDVKVKCAGCVKEYCPACVSANLTIDLCADCMNPARIKVDNINVQYQTCPGTKAARSRQTTLEGPISHTGSNRSGTPPPPLVSGKTQNNDDIEELKQFDRGHLVALEIDGADSYRCIVPMNRQFNQSGKWRTMERTIAKLIDGVDQKNVDGGTVKGGAGSDATLIDLSLRTANTVNKVWHIEIILYYDDKVGDPRIPVWFYVRVYCNKKLRTHFSLGNRCSKAATIPDEQEIIEFWAAKNLFAEFLSFSVPNQKKISIEEETRRYYKPYGQPKSPPNQLLEFMDEVNQRCRVKTIPLVFTKMPSTTIRPRTPYDDVQREILRKFNRWKNRGELKSDIPSADIYPGEPADAWQTLDECGGRASPEVDHIEPSYQQGSNST